MKKKIWIPVAAVVTAFVATACFKNDDGPSCVPNQLSTDRASIDSFISANDIGYLTYMNEGYYQGIANPGTGSTAAADSIVEFKHTISAFNGSTFVKIAEQEIKTNNNGTPIRFSDIDNTLNPAYYYLITNAAQGGSMRQIFPSSRNPLGYLSCEQQTINNALVPAYSQIVEDIVLTTVKKGS